MHIVKINYFYWIRYAYLSFIMWLIQLNKLNFENKRIYFYRIVLLLKFLQKMFEVGIKAWHYAKTAFSTEKPKYLRRQQYKSFI